MVLLAVELRIYNDLPTLRIKRCMLASIKPGRIFYGGVSQEHVEQEVLVGVGVALEIEGVRRVRSPGAPKMTIVVGWESVWTFHRSSSFLDVAERALSQARTRAARCRAAIRAGSSQEPSWRTPLI